MQDGQPPSEVRYLHFEMGLNFICKGEREPKNREKIQTEPTSLLQH